MNRQSDPSWQLLLLSPIRRASSRRSPHQQQLHPYRPAFHLLPSLSMRTTEMVILYCFLMQRLPTSLRTDRARTPMQLQQSRRSLFKLSAALSTTKCRASSTSSFVGFGTVPSAIRTLLNLPHKLCPTLSAFKTMTRSRRHGRGTVLPAVVASSAAATIATEDPMSAVANASALDTILLHAPTHNTAIAVCSRATSH